MAVARFSSGTAVFLTALDCECEKLTVNNKMSQFQQIGALPHSRKCVLRNVTVKYSKLSLAAIGFSLATELTYLSVSDVFSLVTPEIKYDYKSIGEL